MAPCANMKPRLQRQRKIRLELKQAKLQGACSRRAWSSDNAAARPREAASPHARRRIGLRMVGVRTARDCVSEAVARGPTMLCGREVTWEY